ncbi:unnamed protein product [Allacma fusca]|uniref:Uncharacterized protein n=1 Tax=Allacma fusca TaxID=39272 RepID=A0A8J2NQV0_9HEXA|nr:unnamed protein product [Allacma fusca]
MHKMGTGILSSTLRRLKFIAAITAIFGAISFGTSLSIYNWACKIDRDTLPEYKYYCGESFFDCPGKEAWMEGSILAVIAGVYQIISSVFMFRCQLGMRSWIVGNVILATFSLCFAAFIRAVPYGYSNLHDYIILIVIRFFTSRDIKIMTSNSAKGFFGVVTRP